MGSSDRPGNESADTPELDAIVQGTEFFRSLVENSSDAIVSIDERSRILYANESVERVLGHEPEALIGEPLTTIMPERFRSEHHAAVGWYLDTGERTIDWNGVELPAEHADGHEIPLSITFEEHDYGAQRVFSGIMRDVSERAEREARLEQFASIVSHDLRSPLQTARSTLAVARAGDETAFEELDEIFDRMEALIEDVLALAKQGRDVGETEPIELPAAAERAWETAGAPAATLRVEGSPGAIEADPERLRTLFENLFANSVEHGGEGVTVRVGPLEGGGFYVADDGAGFGDADTSDLFEHGHTTESENTGFGLSIVERIADAHGWSIAATTASGGGARFEITT